MKIKTNLLISCAVALVTTCIIVGSTKKEKAPKLPPLTDLSGKVFDASALKGKVYILSYFQTWCGDCVKEQPELQKLQQHFGADKLEVLMVSDEPVEKIEAFKARFVSGLNFYHTDVPLKSEQVGVKKYPTTYLINKKGKVEEVKVEGIEWYTDEMIALVGNLLK